MLFQFKIRKIIKYNLKIVQKPQNHFNKYYRGNFSNFQIPTIIKFMLALYFKAKCYEFDKLNAL